MNNKWRVGLQNRFPPLLLGLRYSSIVGDIITAIILCNYLFIGSKNDSSDREGPPRSQPDMRIT